MKTLKRDDPMRRLFEDPDVLEGAWRRVCAWYKGGEWPPQPEFAAWELNPEAHLHHLGRSLAGGRYRPQPMPLIPYAKRQGRLRHFCQPSVRDQVAFMVFGVLLAPIFETGMENVSFGNRWYRGLVRDESVLGNQAIHWQFRKWALAEDQTYQPYRRAHGLFRRVASWTVDAMLGCPISADTPTGNRVLPQDYAPDMIPEFARPRYWENLPHSDKVYWVRFDLKYAFPSVRIPALRAAARNLAIPPDDDVFRFLFRDEDLVLYPQVVQRLLRSDDVLRRLTDYLCDCLDAIRYQPFKNADHLLFPKAEENPPRLPLGDGGMHPGLPTGLALSPLLLNVYLHGIDRTMKAWLRSEQQTKPAAFLRFADDMILLANDQRILAEGITTLMNAVGPAGDSESDLNLRMNWEKSKPETITMPLSKLRKFAGKADTAEWSNARDDLVEAISKNGITKDSRDPFVTDLVERFSELGLEKETDALPENALSRLTRLQEIVVFHPNDEAVPRETQLVFTANKLVRAWLPEEGAAQDAELLKDIRRSVAEALRDAPDKPRLWRAVIRAALRRPIPDENGNGDVISADAQHASGWLNDLLQRLAKTDGGLLAQNVGSTNDDWNHIWPLIASFHRTSFWLIFAETIREMSRHVSNLNRDKGDLPETESWLYRSFDEQTLPAAVKWLEQQVYRTIEIFYSGDLNSEPLASWEASGLTLALLSVVPRSVIRQQFGRRDFYGRGANSVLAEVVGAYDSRLRAVAKLLPESSTFFRFRADYRRLLWLAKVAPDESKVGGQKRLAFRRPTSILRFAECFGYESVPIDELMRSAEVEVYLHDDRFRTAQKHTSRAVRAELIRYHRARRILLGLGGIHK